VHNIRSIPLRHGNDNLVAFVLTAETEGLDPNQPLIEVALRGYTSEPCIQRQVGRPQPCGDLAGWTPRFTGNIAYDRTLPWDGDNAAESENRDCGSGVNFHQRLALGELEPDGSSLVHIEWNASQIQFQTKADSVTVTLAKPRTARFGRMIVGAPWGRAPKKDWRSWLWNQFQAGVAVDVVRWDAGSPITETQRCP
jgi:hypothetical protein